MRRPNRKTSTWDFGDVQLQSAWLIAIAVTTMIAVVLLVGELDDELDSVEVIESNRDERLQGLLEWARREGSSLPSTVRLGLSSEHGWGVYANETILADSPVCSVPKRLLVMPQREGSPIFNLAFKVLRNPTSPYVLSLPWEDFGDYKSTVFDNDINRALEAFDEKWDPSLFRAAVLIVLSRVHRVKDHPFALVPLCDMFNASPEGRFNVECEDLNDNFFCKTVRTVRENEELLVAYRTSEQLLASRDALRSQWQF